MKTGSSVQELNCYNTAIKALLEDKTSSLILINFTRKKLYAVSLDRNPHEIINEAYLRGVKAICEGKRITNHQSWLFSTVFNVIREIARGSSKVVYDTNLVDYRDESISARSDNPLSDMITGENSRKLYLLLSELGEEDRLVIELRWLQGMSWKNVVQSLSDMGISMSLAAVKKRGSRALDKLHEAWGDD